MIDGLSESLVHGEFPQLTASALRNVGRGFDGRFCVRIEINRIVAEFSSCEILRIIPGTRLVCRGYWNGQRVVAKIFLPQRGLQKRIDRERSGIEALAAAGIPVPRLLAHGILQEEPRARILLFEEIENASSLRDETQRLREPEAVRELLSRAVQLIARQHLAGIQQTDLHLDNFLLKDGTLFAIDGGTVKHVQASGHRRFESGLQNLAIFLVQLPISADVLIPGLFREYATVLGVPPEDSSRALLLRFVKEQRDRRMQIILRKGERECTDYFAVHNFGLKGFCRREYDSPGLRRFLTDPDHAMQVGTLLKKSRSTTVTRVTIDGRDYVVKRYDLNSVGKVLRHLFQSTGAWHSWMNSIRLEALGLPHARGVAYLERSVGPWKRAAYFVAEHVVGTSAQSLFTAGGVNESKQSPEYASMGLPRECDVPASSLLKLLSHLSVAQLSHGDLKDSKIIFRSGDPVLIGLESLRYHRNPQTSRAAAIQDFTQLLQNFDRSSPLYRDLASAAGRRFDNDTTRNDAEQFPMTLRHGRMKLCYRIDSPVPLMSQAMIGVLEQSHVPDVSRFEILKQDRRRSIFRTVSGDRSVVIKAFPFKRLKDKWRWRRYAAAEASNAFRAQSRGISTPEYYGLFQLRRFGLVENCGVIMEDLREFESIAERATLDEKELLRGVSMLVQLFEAGVNHMDASPFNLLVHRDSGREVILDWQYASFTSPRSDAQLVLQGAHFLKYAELSPGTPRWDEFVAELHQAGKPDLSLAEFQAAVRTAQGIRLRPRERARFVEQKLRAA